MPPTRILIVDDHHPFADALALTLACVEGFEVVGHARDGAAGVMQALELRPDVVLMDLQMPRLDGVEATRLLAGAAPELAVIAMSGVAGEEQIDRALAAGARAFVRKERSIVELARTVAECAAGPALVAA